MRIACVHQGYELYGSDRAFIEGVAAIRGAYPAAEIEVVLPRDGPIVGPLRAIASTIAFEPLWILRRRDLPRLAAFGAVTLPIAVTRAARRMAACDLTYINTTVIVDYLLAARVFKGRTVVHVHEIPEGSALPILRTLLSWSRAEIVFNSKASQAAFGLPRSPSHHVVYNGVAGPADPEPATYDGSRPLRVLMLGRINRIKGQEVLLEALAKLPSDFRDRIELRIVGSAFEDAEREAILAQTIRDKGLSDRVTMSPFVDDPAPLYRWADIVAVPSRRPESLGRVAIEAMAFGRPPLASAIGGLREVVEDGRTGWLVEPDNAAALANALRAIVAHPEVLVGCGLNALARYEAMFSDKAAASAIQAVFARVLGRSPETATRVPVAV